MQYWKQHRLQKAAFQTSRSKTERKLGLFDCIEAPCIDRCAINQKVPQYMNAVRDGAYEEALRLTQSDNPIASMLGRVCDHLCESTCIRTHLDEPLAIRDIKRFIMEHETEAGLKTRAEPMGLKIAIIGAGPGGMAAASELAMAGCAVEIFEMHPYAGGMVGGAIPEFRLPQAVFNRDLERLVQLGVKIHYNVKAGRDIHLSQLRKNGFDHVVIMVGAQLGKKLGLAGEESEGVMDALYFLRQAREGKPPAIGQHVGIIGAGDTAMDCARTAWRLSDGRVSVIYRRTIDQMPADREEVHLLSEEGIEVVELAKPQQLLCDGGKLRGLLCRRMEFKGDRDASGRKVPHEVPGTKFEMQFDTLIMAVSQNAILDFLDGEPIELNERGYIKADPVTFETSLAGVYAGGDVANEGPASIVKAAAAGKAIARAILNRDEPAALSTDTDIDTAQLIRRKSRRAWRVPAPQLPLHDRQGFDEVVLTYEERQARNEASRCLDCDVYCSLCVGVCPNLALQTYEADAADSTARQRYQVAVLADLCNECGNCTTFCPTAGRPYQDKPRLYLDREEFEAEDDNAFMVFRDEGAWSMDARYRGETHHLDLDEEPDAVEPFVAMRVLLSGIAGSMPQLPTAGNERREP